MNQFLPNDLIKFTLEYCTLSEYKLLKCVNKELYDVEVNYALQNILYKNEIHNVFTSKFTDVINYITNSDTFTYRRIFNDLKKRNFNLIKTFIIGSINYIVITNDTSSKMLECIQELLLFHNENPGIFRKIERGELIYAKNKKIVELSQFGNITDKQRNFIHLCFSKYESFL
jgi:hypothetical protein